MEFIATLWGVLLKKQIVYVVDIDFRNSAQMNYTGAVDTVPWLSVDKLAEKIAYYDKNRELLSEMVLKAIDFAQQNIQEKWLDRRINWTLNHAVLSFSHYICLYFLFLLAF